MAIGTIVDGVASATSVLREMIANPWSYFPDFIGGDLVGLGQVGPSRFILAFGKSWSSGTPSQTDPPTFSSPVVSAHPRVFDVDSQTRIVTEITPSLLLAPNVSLRAAVMGGTGMHLVASTNTGTHAQFIQNFAHGNLRAMSARPLTPSVWSNGEKRPVEWDRGAASDRFGLIALGADSDNTLYASRVRAIISGTNGYDISRRSYLSSTGWTASSSEQVPLRRVGGEPLASSVPVALARRRQSWLMLLPAQLGSAWGWELLSSPSLTSPFRHVSNVAGNQAGPAPARFFPNIVLETDPTKPPGVAWCCSPETAGSFVPRINQLQV